MDSSGVRASSGLRLEQMRGGEPSNQTGHGLSQTLSSTVAIRAVHEYSSWIASSGGLAVGAADQRDGRGGTLRSGYAASYSGPGGSTAAAPSVRVSQPREHFDRVNFG